MFKWFRDCKTAEAGKQLYRELVRKFHPDNAGCKSRQGYSAKAANKTKGEEEK